MAPAVGIDLGTSYSRVGVFCHGRFEIIPDKGRNRSTLSVIFFTDTGPSVGIGLHQPWITVSDAFRLIGRNFRDSEVQADMKHSPLAVIESRDKPVIKIEFERKIMYFKPEEIITRGVWGMTNKSSLARHQMKKLKVFAGAEHDHAAQNPKELPLSAKRRSVLTKKTK